MKRKEVKEMVEKHGLTLVSLAQNTHWKARVRRADGTEKIVMFPSSASDWRAMKNKNSQLCNIASGAE